MIVAFAVGSPLKSLIRIEGWVTPNAYGFCHSHGPSRYAILPLYQLVLKWTWPAGFLSTTRGRAFTVVNSRSTASGSP